MEAISPVTAAPAHTPISMTALSLFVPPEADDDDDDGLEPHLLGRMEEENLVLKAYIQKLESEVQGYIRKFFQDKKFHCGGPIPTGHLYSDESVSIVINNKFANGIDRCYEALATIRRAPAHVNEMLLLTTLEQVRKHSIPKRFQAGLILLYLKFCKGCRLPASAREGDINEAGDETENEDTTE